MQYAMLLLAICAISSIVFYICFYSNKKTTDPFDIGNSGDITENDPILIEYREELLDNQFHKFLNELDKITIKNKTKHTYLGKKVIELMMSYLDNYNSHIKDKIKLKKYMSPFQFMIITYGCRSIIRYSDKKTLLLILPDILFFLKKYYHIHILQSIIYDEKYTKNVDIKKQALCYCILKFFAGRVNYDIIKNVSKDFNTLDKNVLVRYSKLRSDLITKSIKTKYPRAIRYYERKLRIKNK